MRNSVNTKKSFSFRSAVVLILCGILFFGTLQSANAQSLVTFAQFVQRNAGQDFIFTNNSSNAVFNTINGGTPIFFFYQNINGVLDPSLQGPQLARLYLTSGTSSAAALNNGTLSQPFSNVNNTIVILRDTMAPVGNGSRTNLLTVTFSPIGSVAPLLSGAEGGNSASFSATTPDHIVTFTSDFLNFASSTQRNFALSFSSVLPSLTLGPGNFLNSFNTAGTGTFASNPSPGTGPATAASVSVSGRVLTPARRSLRNALVTITQADGSTRTISTGVNGQFSFTDIEIPQIIILSVRSRNYQYDSRVLSLETNFSELEFVPVETK